MPPQADGEEAAFVLGLSIARPENRLIMLEVDEALLSNLGVLVTISDADPHSQRVRTDHAGHQIRSVLRGVGMTPALHAIMA